MEGAGVGCLPQIAIAVDRMATEGRNGERRDKFLGRFGENHPNLSSFLKKLGNQFTDFTGGNSTAYPDQNTPML
jgi:hypothetical protein